MPYVELHCHSAFSFLDGASHPVELAGAAAAQGHEAMALTDHDGLHGSMAFAHAAAALGVRAITGAELTLDDGHHLTLLCEDRTGYRNLCRLLSRAHEHTRDGPQRTAVPPALELQAVLEHADGLVCLSGCARHGALAGRIERGQHGEAARVGAQLVAAFGPDRLRIELQRPFARNDRRRNRLLAELAGRLGVATVATGDFHVHDRSRAALQDVFVAVRGRATLDESEPARRGNSSHVLAPPEAMARRFADHPEAVHESGRLAERLRFDLTRDLGYRYPGAGDPSADRHLAELCRARIHDRYAGRASRARAEQRLEEELALIRSLGLSGFFVLHRDLLELAREVAHEVRGVSAARAVLPPGRGRGSSVSSIVCYLTGLSHVDPIEKELFLGRFLNEELSALPDIDLDFPRDIREVLLPRVHERYGHERSALVAAFATYQTRSAVRDFGKALGVPPPEVERAARAVDPWGFDHVDEEIAQAVGSRRAASPRWRALALLVREAAGLPRHVTQHSGGMVISTESLRDICPIQPAAMVGRQFVQWDKDSCADAGFLKIDLLGLGMLSAVERCVDEIARVRGEVVDLSRIPFDDPEVYGAIQRAETTGVFQIESRAQMQMLPRTLPENLDDITVQVALVRPGPILGGAVHPYIERRKALREDPSYQVPYEHPLLEPVLRDTLGAIVFQDQVIEVAMAFAGFSPGEAEGLRRAMSRVRSEAAMRSYEERFVAGAMAKGVPRATAERVYGQIVGFSGFGFPKAHSAAFGLLAYQSTWLRVHYGPELLCALLNEQPMGFYPPDLLVHEAQRRGIEVLPPCVQGSAVECRVERVVPRGALGVRMGLGYVGGVRAEDAHGLVAERERGGAFRSVSDLAARCGARPDSLERLAWAGACDALVSAGRREALWLLGATVPGALVPVTRHEATPRSRHGSRPRPAGQERPVQLALPLDPAPAPPLRPMTPWERLLADYGSTKVTLADHPLGLMRPQLGQAVLSSMELARAPDGIRVQVAGLVVARQRPATAKGVTFMLLEDEYGTINLIVPPPVHDACRLAVRAEPLVLAAGGLERREGVINVVVTTVTRLDRHDLPAGEVRHIEPARIWSTEDASGDLRAVAPGAHSFGRRGG
jgi:error-prone DNA polymerase